VVTIATPEANAISIESQNAVGSKLAMNSQLSVVDIPAGF